MSLGAIRTKDSEKDSDVGPAGDWVIEISILQEVEEKSLSIRHLESDLEKLNEFLIEIQLFRLDQTQYSLYYVYHLQRDTTP